MTQDIAQPNDIEETPGDGLPLYLQVASTLRTAILRGVYPVGSRMPTEDALCRRFKVSRHTIREALRQLRADGLIASQPGSRPTVAPPSQPKASEFFADEGGFDYMIGTRLSIAAMDTVPITSALAKETGLPEGEQWLCVTGYRINADDGQATCWNEYFINPKYALVGRLLPRHVGPILPLLEDLFEERITRISRSMTAIGVPAEQAEGFRTTAGSPALRILTRCETPDGTIAVLNRSIHPGGEVSYTIRR